MQVDKTKVTHAMLAFEIQYSCTTPLDSVQI